MAKKKKEKFDLTFATEAQIKEVKQEIDQLEYMLRDGHIASRISEPESLMQEIVKKKKFLSKHTPQELKGQDSNKALAEAKRLKQVIVDAMPPRSMYFQREAKDADRHSKHVDYEKTVQQQIRFQTDPEIIRAVNRYKHLMRQIDPSDPTISNIELLRPNK